MSVDGQHGYNDFNDNAGQHGYNDFNDNDFNGSNGFVDNFDLSERPEILA